MRTLNVCWVVLLLSACTVDTVDFTGKTCAQDSDCQSGLVCIAGACAKEGTQPPGDAGTDADASVVAGEPTVGNLRQLAAGGAALPPGSTVKEAPELHADASDPAGGEVRLEVELIESTSPFAGTPNFIGDYTGGGVAKVSLTGLAPGAYRWQARAVNRDGKRSAFAVYNDGATAFTLLPKAIEGSLTIEDAAAYTRTPVVTLRLQAVSKTGATISQMEFSNDGETWSAAEAFALTRPNWTLGSGDGAKKVYARISDSAGESVIFESTIVLDTTRPELSASVGDGSGLTATTPVRVTLQANDATSGLADLAYSDDGQSFGAPEAFKAEWDWDLGSSDGEKVRFVRVTDKAGNAADLRLGVILDTTKPAGTLEINGGDAWTGKEAVTLSLTATDANGVLTMAFSDDGTTFGNAEPFAATFSYALPPGDGDKTVTVRLTDKAGNVAELSDTIGLDTTPPALSDFLVNGGAPYTTQTQVELTWTASDGGSGISKVVATDASRTATVGNSPALFTLLNGQGPRNVSLAVSDKAGNTTTAAQSITLDSVAPSVPGAFAALARSRAAELQFTPSTDATSGFDHYEVGIARSTIGPFNWTAMTGTQAPLLATGLTNDLDYVVTMRAVDKAGNVSGSTGALPVRPRFAFAFQHRTPAPVTWYGAVHYGSREVVLVGEQGEIARSKEQFRNDNQPTRRDSGTDRTLRAVSYDGDWTVAVGDGGVITASPDRGERWTLQVNGSGSAKDLFGVAPLNDGNPGVATFIAVGASGHAVTGTVQSAGPATFTQLSLPTTNNLRAVASSSVVNGRTVVVGEQGTVLYTTDAGKTWSAAVLPNGYGQMLLRAVDFDRTNNVFYAAGEPPAAGASALLRSTDDGKSWTPITLNPFTQMSIYALAATSNFNETLFVGSVDYSGGVEGKSPHIWRFQFPSQLTKSSPSSGKGRVTALAAVNNGYATAGGEAGAVYIASGTTGPLEELATGAPEGLRSMWGGEGTSPYLWVVGDNGHIAFSGNRGAGWTNQPQAGVDVRAISGQSISQVYAVGAGGRILRGGYTAAWTSITSPVSVPLNDVACTPGQCLAVGGDATVLSTGFAGGAWGVANQETGSGVNLRAVHLWASPSGSAFGAAVGELGAVRYLNGTNLASASIAGAGTLIAIDSARASGTAAGYALALSEAGSVYRTNDGGKNWAQVGSLGAGVIATGLGNAGGSRWFAVTKSSGAFRSSDDGVTWQPLPTEFTTAFGFVHSPNGDSTWIGGAGGALLHSQFPDAL